MSIVQDSLARSGLEVYKTKEEEPSMEDAMEDALDTALGDDTEDTGSDELEDENSEGFKLLNGETEEIHHYSGMYSNSIEEDYADITASGGATFHEIDPMQVYKGKKICLKKEWETPTKAITWDDLKPVLLGFVTEQTYSQDKVELKFCGMDKLMDRNAIFDFHQMHRSEIIEAIIEEAGLESEVDTTGLVDDIIDFSNKSSSGSDDDTGEGVSAGGDIDAMVKKWTKGKKGALDKAMAIHNGLKAYGIVYSYYYNFHYNSAQECLQHAHSPGLNCGDTAQLTTAAMKSAGLDAHIELRCDSAHFFTVIVINGTKYYSDLTGSTGARSTRAWNDVWEGNKCGNPYSR